MVKDKAPGSMQSAAKDKLVRLKAERIDMLQQIDELTRRLTQNAMDIADLAPVNTIPDDVLKLILEEVYAHHIPLGDPTPELCQMDSPLVATHVCRRWRNVAINLPTLWTCIHSDDSDYAIALFVARSHPFPLQFVGESAARPFADFAPLLQQNAARWKSMQLHGAVPLDNTSDFMDIMRTMEFPLLEYMALHCGYGGALGIGMGSGPVVPKLKHFAMDRLAVHWGLPEMHNLQILSIDGLESISRAELRSIFLDSPCIVELTIRALDDIDIDEEPRALHLPFLHTIRFIDANWKDTFLQIDASRLHTFICCKSAIPVSLDGEMHESLKLYPSLTHMRLERCFMESDASEGADVMLDTCHLFRQAPNLESLELIDCCTRNMSKFLDWLRDTTADEGHILMPELKTVTMTNVQLPDFGTIEEFVKRRSKLEHPLQELKLGQETIIAMGRELVQTLAQLILVTVIPDPVEYHPFI